MGVIIFILLILLGLLAFFLVLMREMKGSLSRATPPLPGPLPKFSSQRKNPETLLLDKLDEKCLKLEQLLSEKNQALLKLEEELRQERSCSSEFESLRNILEMQIHDLKTQNRKLKDDLAMAAGGMRAGP
jgi:septal ring factor EnvC (AmiA/AmiB activator)